MALHVYLEIFIRVLEAYLCSVLITAIYKHSHIGEFLRRIYVESYHIENTASVHPHYKS